MMQSTNAHMTITNDYPLPLVVTVSKNMNMKDTFPSQIIEARKTSFLSYISTGTHMSQSYFDIAYGSNTIKVNIGQGSYVTNASFFGPKSHTGTLLAPTKPFSKDIDYTFYFFAGPGILPPLINSFFIANLPAIVAYVSTHPLHIDLNNDIKIIIKQLDFTPQSIHCSYAALSPIQHHGNNQQWHINIILNINGKISGSIVYHSMDMNFHVTFNNGTVLLQAIVNMSNLQAFSCTVTKLAFSIQSFALNDDLLTLVQTFFPAWYKLIDTPYHLASTLNIKYNSVIIEKLNEVIEKLLVTTSIKDAFEKRSISTRRPCYDDSRNVKQTKVDQSRWMSTPRIQSKTVSQLKIPGTHNSGSYGLTRKLSQIMYKNIKFLWGLSADSAPTNGQLSFNTDRLYVGPILFDYIIDTTLRISISQNRTIRQQLDDGIRFFDLRIYYDTDGSFYIQHALRGPELNDVLLQIRHFLDAHSTSGELIFLSISHTNFANDPENLPSQVATIIQNNLKPYLYVPANSVGMKHFDLENFGNMTLSSITTTDSNVTSPKVIVLNTDNADVDCYKDTVLNTRGFADSGRWEINSDGVNSLTQLIEVESQGLKENMKSNMYHISWIQTPQIMDIIQNILNHLSGNPPTMLLKELALETNSAFQDFLKNHTMNTFNLVTMDWYDISSTTKNLVNTIIGLN